jgi:hypothetical protein
MADLTSAVTFRSRAVLTIGPGRHSKRLLEGSTVSLLDRGFM